MSHSGRILPGPTDLACLHREAARTHPGICWRPAGGTTRSDARFTSLTGARTKMSRSVRDLPIMTQTCRGSDPNPRGATRAQANVPSVCYCLARNSGGRQYTAYAQSNWDLSCYWQA